MNLQKDLTDALSFLLKEGRIRGFEEAEERLFWVKCSPAVLVPEDHPRQASFSCWNALAFELSMLLGGSFWAGDASCTWTYAGEAIWLTDRRRETELSEARMIAADVICGKEAGRFGEMLPMSVAGCARAMLNYLDVTEPARSSGEHMRRGVKWHYQHCTPRTAPKASLFDVSAYHATIATRMPSPLVSFYGDGEVSFRPLPRAKAERWRRIVSSVYAHKGLRNALIGSMIGQDLKDPGKQKFFYSKGRRVSAPAFGGVLRPAGLLIVRTAYELCAEAVEETRAIYSNQDCVITEDGEHSPRIWERLGFRVERRAEGESEICAVGVYRVGEKKTKWYEAGSRSQIPSRAVSVEGPHFARWFDRVRIG